MTQPNIIMILIDDLGCRDLGCFGSSFYETPHLDRLASQGMTFQNAFAACPVCSPTRAAILSGKYPARVGVTQFIGGNDEGKLATVPYLHYLPLTEVSLARSLKKGGYQTWHVGKWHLGDEAFFPEKHGFEVNFGGCHWGHPKNGYFSPWGIDSLPEDGIEEGTYLTDHLTDRAIDLIKNRSNKPFFLNLAHYAVHTPIQAPQDLVEKYSQKAKRLRLDQINPMVEGDYFPCLHKSDQKIQRRIIQSDPKYAAMMENLDTNIGKLLQSLDDEGIADNTLVIFTSDNGGLATAEGSPTCNAPYAEGKGWAQDGGIRVCQIARWPKQIQAGSQCHEAVTSTDFYPTFLKAAGLAPMPEQHVDGIDLTPVFSGGKLEREAIYWHYPHYGNQGGSPNAVILMGDWKLIYFFETPDTPELYHVRVDVSESENVAKTYADICQRLLGHLQKWLQEIEAQIPVPNADWEKRLKRPLVPNNAHE